MDSHHLTGLLDALCQHIVGLARRETARRVVMAAGEDGGIGKYRFLHHDTDVCRGLADTSLANAYRLYQFVCLVHQQNPKLHKNLQFSNTKQQESHKK